MRDGRRIRASSVSPRHLTNAGPDNGPVDEVEHDSATRAIAVRVLVAARLTIW